MKKILFLLPFIFLCACSNMTQAQREQERISSQIKVANDASNNCTKEISNDVYVKKFYDEIFYENDSSANKMSLMLSKEKLTEEQIDVVKKAVPLNYKCRQMIFNAMANNPYLPIAYRYFETMDKTYLSLAKLEITIGEANEAKSKAVAQQKADWASISADLDNKFRNNHNAEMENRRQQASIMLPLMMQQQQNQQLLYQQQIQNINNNRPITTNCNTYGTQTNCVSR